MSFTTSKSYFEAGSSGEKIKSSYFTFGTAPNQRLLYGQEANIFFGSKTITWAFLFCNLIFLATLKPAYPPPIIITLSLLFKGFEIAISFSLATSSFEGVAAPKTVVAVTNVPNFSKSLLFIIIP